MGVFIISTLMGCNPSETKESLGVPFSTENDLSQSHDPAPYQFPISTTESADIEDIISDTKEVKTEEVGEVRSHHLYPRPIPGCEFPLPRIHDPVL